MLAFVWVCDLVGGFANSCCGLLFTLLRLGFWVWCGLCVVCFDGLCLVLRLLFGCVCAG